MADRSVPLAKTLPAPPIIDLAGCVKVIDEKTFKWRTVARVPVASEMHAKRVLQENGLVCGWLFDDLGNKRFINIL